MNQEKQLLKQSKIRDLLIQAELVLKEDRYEEALVIINDITFNEMKDLSMEELSAIGRLLICLKEIAEGKRNNIVDQLKTVQASKGYIG
ncbi:hypothetical protein [Thermodesulfovibrio thiophilus]|uniref:hypothetical protein n=1 Tax=Thermodesulfovibrio thiophilus TaxID=340095 RepID=UPI00183B82C6|nr:hypothetical protein [Thermodesulfovibrio thiophilus]HHW21214.1 hypothetical protein [Thermodesulfovibrio thiophilus]